jgi:hypothetical protein
MTRSSRRTAKPVDRDVLGRAIPGQRAASSLQTPDSHNPEALNGRGSAVSGPACQSSSSSGCWSASIGDSPRAGAAVVGHPQLHARLPGATLLLELLLDNSGSITRVAEFLSNRQAR